MQAVSSSLLCYQPSNPDQEMAQTYKKRMGNIDHTTLRSLQVQLSSDVKDVLNMACIDFDIAALPVGLIKRLIFVYAQARLNRILSSKSLLNKLKGSGEENDITDTYTIIVRKSSECSPTGMPRLLYDCYDCRIYVISNYASLSSIPRELIKVQLRGCWATIIISEVIAVNEGVLTSMADTLTYILSEGEAYFSLKALHISCGCCGKLDMSSSNDGWMRDEERLLLEFISVQCIPTSDVSRTSQVIDSPSPRGLCLVIGLTSAAAMPPAAFECSIIGHRKVRDLAENLYILYSIVVKHGSLQWIVTRRYSAFIAIHDSLRDAFNNHSRRCEILLPILPSKKWINNLSPPFISRRQKQLQRYLDELMAIPEAVAELDTLSFLGAISTTWYEHERCTGLNREIVHLRQLRKAVSVGDVIMFRCYDALSGIQRTVTRSEWDHIAMVVRGDDLSSYMLLEATGDGVTVSPLVGRIRAYASCFTRYIVLRKLSAPEIDTFTLEEKLTDFVNKVKGKPYSLCLSKFLGLNEASDTMQSFFCSELVAAAFKHVNLIDRDLLASSFWPGCFGVGGQIDSALQEYGASLGNEIIIDCRSLEVGRAYRTSDIGRHTI